MGHRIHPVGLRLNVMQSWDTISPSKSVYLNDFFFKHYFFNELYGFFSKRWVSEKDLKEKFIKKAIKQLEYNLFKILKNNSIDLKKNKYKNSLLYNLFFFKKYLKSKRAIRQKESKLFYQIYDIYINLNKNMQLDYCIFQKILGKVNLKFYFKLSYLESEFFNSVRFSQKWLKIKLFSLTFFKSEKFITNHNKVNYDLYSTLYLYDYKYRQNYFFNFSKNYSNSFYYLYSLFLNISTSYINYYLNNFNFFFKFFKKFILNDLSGLKKVYKRINMEFVFHSFSNSSANLFSKYLKYRLKNYESVGRVVHSFFRHISMIFKKVYRLRSQLMHTRFFLNNKSEKFYLTDDLFDFSGFIEIYGLKIFGSGRFTKKRRVKAQKFYKRGIPLNQFHKNVSLNSTDIRFKYGIAGVKIWIYKSSPVFSF